MNRFESVNQLYIPYVEKYLSGKPLQNILVSGGCKGSISVEKERHKNLTYQNIFHYEIFEDIIKSNDNMNRSDVLYDNILHPNTPIESVNVIFADVGGGTECFDLTIEKGLNQGVTKIISSALQKNNLGMLIFLYFDGLGIESFLDRDFGFKSKDFFSKNVEWFDEHNNTTNNQRLDGVVFYD